jgi:hypothetical protein
MHPNGLQSRNVKKPRGSGYVLTELIGRGAMGPDGSTKIRFG